MILLVESFLYPNKLGIPEEGWRIQQPKRYVTPNNNKDEDNSLKNNTKYCTSSLVSKIQTDTVLLHLLIM